VARNIASWNARAGQYETTTVSGSGIGAWQKIVRTDYAIDNTSDGSTACPSAEALYAAWLPGVVASRSVWVKVGEEPEQLKELAQFAFDTATGRTTDQVARLSRAPANPCAATLGAIAPEPGDVVTSFTFDLAGNVVHEGILEPWSYADESEPLESPNGAERGRGWRGCEPNAAAVRGWSRPSSTTTARAAW